MAAPDGNKNAKNWNLTEKQKKFCQEYIIDLNGKQAAIRAGYSEKTAENQASRMLSKVKVREYVTYLKQNTAKKLEITHEMLTAEWAKMAFSNITETYKNWMTLEDFELLKREKPELMSCIQEISTKTEYRKEENKIKGKVEWVKLKFYDKQKALENLGKHVDYYNAHNISGIEGLTELLKPFKELKK